MGDYRFGDWERLLFNGLPATFLLEVVLRVVVMFGVVLLALRATGKRGVRQLSVFELVLILTLGSASGDPMFYEDVGLVPGILVFVVVILCYRAVTWLAAHSKTIEHVVEGKVLCLVRDGEFVLESLSKSDLAVDEFFMELRLQKVSHLGQLQRAYLEPNGSVSVVFYETDEEIRFGLPLWPELFDARSEHREGEVPHACAHCGRVEEKPSAGPAVCRRCQTAVWVKAMPPRTPR
jgi:uncharacterized membrane protein YcaP (DUF421 family)